MGNVVVEKQIVDSTIECSGGCSMINGMLIASQVSAKMGLMTHSISSGKDGPSTVRVGLDVFCARELEQNSVWMARLANAIQGFDKKKNGVHRQLGMLKKQMTELIRVRDKIQVKLRQTKPLEELPPEDRVAVEERSAKLKKTLKAAKTKIQACAEKIRAVVKQDAKIDQQRAGFEASKKTLADEKKM